MSKCNRNSKTENAVRYTILWPLKIVYMFCSTKSLCQKWRRLNFFSHFIFFILNTREYLLNQERYWNTLSGIWKLESRPTKWKNNRSNIPNTLRETAMRIWYFLSKWHKSIDIWGYVSQTVDYFDFVSRRNLFYSSIATTLPNMTLLKTKTLKR